MPRRRFPSSLANGLFSVAQQQLRKIVAAERKQVERVQHSLAHRAVPVQRIGIRYAVRATDESSMMGFGPGNLVNACFNAECIASLIRTKWGRERHRNLFVYVIKRRLSNLQTPLQRQMALGDSRVHEINSRARRARRDPHRRR
jgi:hypothetical protein